MLQDLYFYIKQVYGQDTCYLSQNNDPGINQAILGLTGRKSLTTADMNNLKKMGFNLVRTFD